MGKVDDNKQQKLNALLNAAYDLFTTQSVEKTTIAEISKAADVAKGTFYLYFKDKYEIRNRLISHESSKLFKDAVAALEKKSSTVSEEPAFEEKMIFIINYIVDALEDNHSLLTFISKNLSWGVFKEALTTNVASNDINFKDIYYEMLSTSGLSIEEPEILLFLVVELVGSTCYSSILYNEPANIGRIKPYLSRTVRAIIREYSK
ncbi:MAG: TetR/AcrR family transcriptional regulator [Butyrivibrio sp.]|uniref:TetR/AcrR family transcriptional regulator n=1 Tax=Eshraghiella crossota TaxID=45851 RepID=UPI00303DFFCF|nr:TetR/AcrR family transcriptional regulator [Butyrivibrio sp.]